MASPSTRLNVLLLVLWLASFVTWAMLGFGSHTLSALVARGTVLVLAGALPALSLGRWLGKQQLRREEQENERALAALSGTNPTNGEYVVRGTKTICPMCGAASPNEKACQPGARKGNCRFPFGQHLHLMCRNCGLEWLYAKDKW